MDRKRTRLFVTALVFGLLAAAPTAWGVNRAAHKAAPQDVFVTNTASDPVPATVVGTPSVNVANSPTVTVAGTPQVVVQEQPFQQFVGVSSTGGENCAAITPPNGKTLIIEQVSFEVEAQQQPEAYILTLVQQPNGGNLVRQIRPELRQFGSDWDGHITGLYLPTGSANDPDGNTYSYRLCVRPSGAFAGMRAFASGRLLG